MSTFSGKMIEFPEISVDRFDGDNGSSDAYFLSHCHTDHMKGLEDESFQGCLLRRPDVFLYSSPVLIRILKGVHPDIQTKLKELPIGVASLIELPTTKDCLTVTLLPAGHCPGSVMILFKAKNTVLYTGEYRVSISDLRKFSSFYSSGNLKTVHNLYLDTTFFNKSYLTLPPREESLQEMCKIVDEWIKIDRNHVIKIVQSARYGSEHLFVELAKRFGMPVHVGACAYNFYKYIPEMDGAVTTQSTKTQIHADCGSNKYKLCRLAEGKSVRKVTPSVLWWESRDLSKGCAIKTGEQEFRVCYSCHSSYAEIKDFVLFLRPKRIEPLVVPDDRNRKESILTSLTELMELYKDGAVEDQQQKLYDENCIIGRVPVAKQKSDIPVEVLRSPNRKFKQKRL